MKQEFSAYWKGSKQPRKQRKFRANAPLHVRHRFLSAQLSKSLKEKYNQRNVPLRKGDEVLVMRGKFAKKQAKVMSVDLKKNKIILENLNTQKKDGTKVSVYFDPSNLQIQTLNLDDKKRMKNKTEKTKTKEKENAPEKSRDK